jgi:putative hydroxymethylpyrimidine transport system substrate-binding protein
MTTVPSQLASGPSSTNHPLELSKPRMTSRIGTSRRLKRRPRWTARVVTVAAAVSVLILGGCGSSSSSTVAGSQTTGGVQHLTLMLDFVPSAYHIGIYDAMKNGYYKKNHIDLSIIAGPTPAQYGSLVSQGKADIGLADGVDLLTFINKGLPYEGILATLQQPLAGIGVLKSSGIVSPKQLDGKKVATPGSPSNLAFLNTMMASAGGDPTSVKLITTGYDFAKDLVANKIDAFTGYATDAIQAQVESGVPLTFLPINKFGGPNYPGLMFYATRAKISANPKLMQEFVTATREGYADTIAHPKEALAAFLSLTPTDKAAPTQAALNAVLPLFQGSASQYGQIDLSELSRLSAYLVKNKLLTKAVPASTAATNQFNSSSGQ